MLLPLIAEHLSTDDDPDLWDVATTTLLAGASAAVTESRTEIYSQIGCCRHWIRPHQSRWTADGGFAWPFGYDKTTTGWSFLALPEFTWSVSLRWNGDGWEPGRTGRRCLVFRVAVPARSVRHMQAAIHTIWTPNSPSGRVKALELYGFRKREGVWSLTASQQLPGR